MAGVIPNSAKVRQLRDLLKIPLVLRIYVNDRNPGLEDEVSNYTEVLGSGYSSEPLVPERWTLPDASRPRAIYPEVKFVFSDEIGKVFGYYVTREQTGELEWAERFSDGPYDIKRWGDEITVVPNRSVR